ncbi:galactose-3-O-sulfotransferase 3 isoform X2 [Protopterus annectens]|nr:galactose-3-O-sulfotransferase 3 isoform X2 [Protopterus annectens]XP_043931762.1 galactose-3-O-sulfotransferase 3 isoform X2 [Protopterus annectens]
MAMSRKKMLLFFMAITTLSFLLHQSGHLTWYTKPFHFGCFHQRATKEKRTEIVFLKTHKTASSTVQNILFRFAEKNNITVALPIHGCDHQFCYPGNFSKKFVHPYTIPPHIITNHMRFNFAELQQLMPNNSVYVTILREPVAMFESLFSYYNQHCQSFKRVPNNSMEIFLSNPLKYYKADERYSMYAHNTLVFDLGGDKDHSPLDEEYINSFIKQIESIFSLVMIAEYFDESLILLKDLLSWDLDDILYVKLNMRSKESKHNISSDIPQKVQKWNAFDAKLYEYFNNTFWKKVQSFGPDCMEKEVQLLNQSVQKLMQDCFGGWPQLRSSAQIKNKELRPWQPSSEVSIIGYDLPVNSNSVATNYCLKLVMPEVQYSRYLLRKATIKIRKKIPYHQMRKPIVSLQKQKSAARVNHLVRNSPVKYRTKKNK